MRVVSPSIVISAVSPVPFPPVKGTLIYSPGAYPEPALKINPPIPSTSKETIAPLELPPVKETFSYEPSL